ncbi:helix-turn-helix domain-containing protein [Nocardia paucivorans]|uniref:AraC-like ligand-binding domain-containing protein n=1 Tax=Nocardia paucivorans TaxID=114259 RepID=UPI00031471B8|nr:helix-turn-helix domain-containing protein [Nocardia paucivorans]
MNSAAVVESATTSTVDPWERADYWAELIESYHCRMGYEFPRREGFHGRTVLRRTGTYQLIGWRSDAVTYYRTTRHVREDPDEDYRLILPTAGPATFRRDDQDAALPSNAGCLVTIDRPFGISLGEGTEGLIMTIPRQEIEARLDRVAPPVRPLDFGTGLGRVVADLATSLCTQRDTLDRHQFDAVADRLVELLCLLVRDDHTPGSDRLTEVEFAVRRYIRAHAHDPELTGAAVAHALGWSLRQVQLALQHAGTTPRELIKEEKLRLAYARLRDPAYRHWSIASLALGLGFGSASAFSTAFRRRFGANPRDIRHG